MRALIDEEERRLADKAEEQDQEKCGRNDSRCEWRQAQNKNRNSNLCQPHPTISRTNVTLRSCCDSHYYEHGTCPGEADKQLFSRAERSARRQRNTVARTNPENADAEE